MTPSFVPPSTSTVWTKSQNTVKAEVGVHWNADAFPKEFTFEITDEQGTIILQNERAETTQGSLTTDIESGRTYCFRGMDDYGDGICCDEGNGSYEVKVNGNRVLEGGDFRFSTGYHCFQVDERGNTNLVEPPATELCEHNDPDNFNICIEIVDVSKGLLESGSLLHSFSKAFLNAKQTWGRVLTADDGTSHNVLGFSVDDIYIEAAAASIDGSGSNNLNILGFAGPGLTWTDPQGFIKSFTGYLALDTADLWTMVNENTLGSVVTHEIAHVLGLGTLWKDNGLYEELGEYTGRHANEAYRNILQTSGAQGDVSQWTVPIEEDGEKGTIYVHWDEGCLRNEILTGMINSVNILSNITLGGLHDLGFEVNYNLAEAYTIPDISVCIESRRRRLGGSGSKHRRRRRHWRQLHGDPVDDLDPHQVAVVTRIGHEFLEKKKNRLPNGVSNYGSKLVDVLFTDDKDNIFSLFVQGEESKDTSMNGFLRS